MCAMNGMLYAVGGWTAPDTVTRRVEFYNPVENKWTYVSSLSIGLHEHAGQQTSLGMIPFVISRGSELILVCPCIFLRASVLGNADIVRVTPPPAPQIIFNSDNVRRCTLPAADSPLESLVLFCCTRRLAKASTCLRRRVSRFCLGQKSFVHVPPSLLGNISVPLGILTNQAQVPGFGCFVKSRVNTVVTGLPAPFLESS